MSGRRRYQRLGRSVGGGGEAAGSQALGHLAEIFDEAERRRFADIEMIRGIRESGPELGREIRAVPWWRVADPGLDRVADRELDELEGKTCRDAVARVGPMTIRLCARCRRILRSPKARQCFHCGNDWHDEEET